MKDPSLLAPPTTGRRGRPSPTDIRRRTANLLRVARSEFVRNGYRRTTMARIAAAAGVTKRTLYLWHADKAALFRACVIEGAQRFPVIDAPADEPIDLTLGRYFSELICELTSEDSNAMGRLFLREGSEFPEMAPIIERGFNDYIVSPLAEYLRRHGLEKADATQRTELLVMMALAPVHNELLLGRTMPDATAARAHVKFVVQFFLEASAHHADVPCEPPPESADTAPDHPIEAPTQRPTDRQTWNTRRRGEKP